MYKFVGNNAIHTDNLLLKKVYPVWIYSIYLFHYKTLTFSDL